MTTHLDLEPEHINMLTDALSEAWEHLGERLDAERHCPELAPAELARLEWRQGIYLALSHELRRQQGRQEETAADKEGGPTHD